MLCVVDEFTHECLAIRVKRKLNNADVIETLADIILSRRALPEFMRSDNGPEFIAKALRKWIGEIGVKTAYIEKGSPWENGFVESFNARLRDELLNGEIFYTLQEAQIVVEAWRRHFNAVRPHSSLKGRPPAPESIVFTAADGIRPWLARKEEPADETPAEIPPVH
jgi:transposase InsO family protein